MTDRRPWLERSRAGEPFAQPEGDPRTDEFFALLFAAQKRTTAYNALPPDPSNFGLMETMLHELLGKVGKGVVVVPPIYVDVGVNVELGDNAFFNSNTTFLDTYPITIGRDVMVGPNCSFYAVGHPLRESERNIRDPQTGEKIAHLATGKPIVVEDGVWIGGNVVVIQGVTIGARSVIGAGSVVTKSIPPDVFAAGNPCRVIRAID